MADEFLSAGTPQPDRGGGGLPGATQRSVYTDIPSGPHPSDFMDKINYRGVEAFAGAAQNVFDKVVIQPKIDEAAQQGAQAVVRDPTTGALSVEYKPGFFAWDKAYNDAASKAYVASASSDVRTNMFALAQQNANDPVAFQTAAAAWTKNYIAKAPAEVRGDLAYTAAQEQSRFTEGVFQNKAKADIADAQTALKSEYDENVNQAFALARQGGEGTPDFITALDKAKAATDKMVTNPLFGYSKADQAKDLSELQGGLQAQTIIGHAVNTGKAEGEQAGLDMLETAIWDPKLNLSPAQRSSFAASGRQEIRENAQATRAAQTEHQQDLLYKLDDAAASAETTGDYSRITTPNEIISTFGQFRGQQIVEKLNAKVAIFGMRRNVARATPAQLAEMNASLKPGDQPAPQAQGGFDAAWAFTLRHEGGYSPHDANGAPVNFGINQAAHPEVDVSKLTPSTAKPIAKSGYWDQVGAENLPANMQAAAFDTAYIFGPKTAKAMIDQSGGDPNKLIDIRESAMHAMIARDPAKFGKYQHAWDARNDDLRALANGSGGQDFSQFAAKKQEYDAFVQAVGERNKALSSDSAAYVINVRPDIAKSLASTDPGTFQTGLRSLIQTQHDMGVTVPRILSKPTATAIIQEFNNPPDPTKKADNMVGVLDSLEHQYGKYYPQVMGELSKSGMPSDVVGLDWVKGDPTVSSRMANAVNTGRSNLLKVLPDGGKDIDKNINSGLSDFNGTLKGFGGSLVSSQMAQATQLYAYQLVAEGVDPGSAAEQAVNDIVGKNFHIQDTYRVPSYLDESAVSDGARAAQDAIMPQNVEPYAGAAAGVSLEDRHNMSATILKGQGVWLTLPDNSGLALSWPAQTGYLQARNSAGKPIQYSWQQLLQMGKGGLGDAESHLLTRGARR